ncbi:uncharacterized protein V1510DRAFT_422126 [Dipodascopsis tothii]|uniref:uncharacterized protein n=1 Tax=Dipodascopsis tothii TaxID=44089 RepID=UPI0034CFBE33
MRTARHRFQQQRPVVHKPSAVSLIPSPGGATRQSPSAPTTPERRYLEQSASLRQAVAKAREDHAHGENVDPKLADAADASPFDNVRDPFNVRPSDLPDFVLRKIETGRKTGRLNLSATGLKELPDEVYDMYVSETDPDLSFDTPPRWVESTDMERFLAADNEIEKIEDRFAREFPNLVTLDLHGNAIRKLPQSLFRLVHLKRLNLAGNRLTNAALDVIFQLPALVDLDLHANKFDGAVPDALGKLTALQTLNLDQNEFTAISEAGLGALGALRELSAKHNRLAAFPWAGVAQSVVEINIAHNKIVGSLVGVARPAVFASVQRLYASHNHASVFAEFSVSFPRLEVVDVSSNALLSLGTLLLDARELTTLQASRNRLSSYPQGLFDAAGLRHLDISFNTFTELDPRLGLLDSLAAFAWEGNKFRERALSKLPVPQVLAQLRARIAFPIVEPEPAEPAVADAGAAKRLTRSLTKSGVLDLSGRMLAEIPPATLDQYSQSYYGRAGTLTELLLLRNCFTTIPPAIRRLAFVDQLERLDLSHNSLAGSAFDAPLTLAALLELNLSCNALTTLDGLIANVRLPSLLRLDVSFNKLTAVPVELVATFATLEELVVHENKIGEIDARAFVGLEKIDLSNNAIALLPPEIGNIKTIVELKVHGNTFKHPRWQIVQKGTEALMEWLKLRIPDETAEERHFG